MSGLVIIAALIIFIGGYFIWGSDKIINYIEQYSVDKIKDPDLEKISYYNIKYMELTEKNGRAIELMTNFLEKGWS